MNAPIATETRWPRWVQRVVRRYRVWKRERDIILTCGCVCYCPHCGDPLNDRATWLDPNNEGHGRYQ